MQTKSQNSKLAILLTVVQLPTKPQISKLAILLAAFQLSTKFKNSKLAILLTAVHISVKYQITNLRPSVDVNPFSFSKELAGAREDAEKTSRSSFKADWNRRRKWRPNKN